MQSKYDITARIADALASFGFNVGALRFERIARCIRVELPAGPALAERFTAALAAIESTGLGFEPYARDRAVVVFSPIAAL